MMTRKQLIGSGLGLSAVLSARRTPAALLGNNGTMMMSTMSPKVPYLFSNNAIALTDILTKDIAEIEIGFLIDISISTTSNVCLFGGRVGPNNQDLAAYMTAYGYFNLRFGTALSGFNPPVPYFAPMRMRLSKTRCIISNHDGSLSMTKAMSGSSNITDDIQFSICGFTGGVGGISMGNFKGSVYFVKVYGNDSLIGDFVPSEQGDVAGFLDNVSARFYPSVTSSRFVYHDR